MRQTFTIILILLVGISLQAQQREPLTVPLSNPGQSGYLKVKTHSGQVDISTHNKQEVEVILIDKERSKSDKKGNRSGLKRIIKQDLDVSISEDNNEVNINSTQNSQVNMKIKVPENFSLNITTHHNGDITVSGVKGTIETQAHHGGIRLEDVAGSVIANTHHGAVVVNLANVYDDTPMAFTTYHGDVDISFPPDLSAMLKMKSSKGDIYTDFDFEVQKPKIETTTNGSRKEIKLEGWTYGKIGSGGEEMTFKTYHGDVIIRKN